MCLSDTEDLVRVGRKWKMINIQVTLRLQKLTKTFRKSAKLFAIIAVWVWEWLQTWWETVRQTLWKKRPNLWKNKSGCCIRTMLQLTMPFCSRCFFPINAFEYLNILHIHGFSTLWLFFCTPKWKVYWREPIFHQLKRLRQKWHSYWTAWGLMSYGTALNNGRHECSGLQIRDKSTLKGIRVKL